MNSVQKKAIIIGAGPAGLTAAIELLKHTDIKPIVLELSDCIGGISRTVRFKDNRMDIGGHRFFSKSDEIIDWWLNILPLEEGADLGKEISYQNKHRTLNNASSGTSENQEDVMLIRKRKSRIFYDGNFFDYPVTLSLRTILNLGFIKIIKIGYSYISIRLFPIKNEKNLEDFFINRFGKELYLTFFKSYTEKVWGKKCTEIGADWGRQRIKGLSVTKTITDVFKRMFRNKGFRQKDVETSLIEYFLYPKYGPGHMWETVAEKIKKTEGEIIMDARAVGFRGDATKITGVTYINQKTKEEHTIDADYVFSTMPINKVFEGFEEKTVSESVSNIARALEYREFITVGILISSEHLKDVTDNWIYIHEPDVHVGRIQFFHNWSESMVKEEGNHLLGLEYFCDEGDYLWNLSESELGELARAELVKIGLIENIEHVLDFHVEKVEKAYPVYAGTYSDFDKVRSYLDSIQNFYPIGRNGMHRYNNQDHSMLTAMASVQSILGKYEKKDIWNINADQEYHEGK
jgi:protoporphyrinogen oxidase